MHADAFADLLTEREWAMENLGEEILAEWMEHPELRKIVEFDVGTFGEPDQLLEEGHTLRLGVHEVRALHCPGHARGSICYAVDDMLFSGDVLFRGSVGRVDVQNSSREDQIASVRRLYAEFPDETVVYPGHGEPTTIGEERTGNERISETAVDL
jgi:glyoxylase-like metal-dependent hydrolase (beta-lactamase superfamily II)